MAGVSPTATPRLSDSSPSPLTSPTLSPCLYPPTERSLSMGSTFSTSSRRSSGSRSSDVLAARRRGYARPQATTFAESAKNRESVMSLGTIAHLQYYFARTGLLDGKGAQLFKGDSRNLPKKSASDGATLAPPARKPLSRAVSEADSTYSSMRSSPELSLLSESEDAPSIISSDNLVEEPEDEDFDQDPDAIMLPPTVSTYNHRMKPVPKLPRVEELRKDLRNTLQDAKTALDEAERDQQGRHPHSVDEPTISVDEPSTTSPSAEAQDSTPDSPNPQGWYELQGIHLLDVMTLAIRAAKIYYTAHEQPARLAVIKSERKIRQELLAVMEALKKLANRYFAGGLRTDERQIMQEWVAGVEDLLAQEEQREALESQERDGWKWVGGDWTGREHSREWAFLCSFDPELEKLPAWSGPPPALPLDGETTFLKTMQNGVRLINLHNALVSKSKRPFGHIPTFHTDTMKPYRCAENLRYWVKAAELRWEVVLRLDVMAVVYGRDERAWRQFDAELLRWCAKVREEISDDLKKSTVQARVLT